MDDERESENKKEPSGVHPKSWWFKTVCEKASGNVSCHHIILQPPLRLWHSGHGRGYRWMLLAGASHISFIICCVILPQLCVFWLLCGRIWICDTVCISPERLYTRGHIYQRMFKDYDLSSLMLSGLKHSIVERPLTRTQLIDGMWSGRAHLDIHLVTNHFLPWEILSEYGSLYWQSFVLWW